MHPRELLCRADQPFVPAGWGGITDSINPFFDAGFWHWVYHGLPHYLSNRIKISIKAKSKSISVFCFILSYLSVYVQ